MKRSIPKPRTDPPSVAILHDRLTEIITAIGLTTDHAEQARLAAELAGVHIEVKSGAGIDLGKTETA